MRAWCEGPALLETGDETAVIEAGSGIDQVDGVSGFGVADGADDGVGDGETAGSPALRYGEGLGGALDVVEGEDLGAGSPPGGGGFIFQDDLDGSLDQAGPGGGPVAGAGGSAH